MPCDDGWAQSALTGSAANESSMFDKAALEQAALRGHAAIREDLNKRDLERNEAARMDALRRSPSPGDQFRARIPAPDTAKQSRVVSLILENPAILIFPVLLVGGALFVLAILLG